ncbi:hypothetical protein A2415_01325 [candidate division WWE3 bacterium RIFOXYC1_FULL_39_7]|uniref:PDZ domain-containing protein n=2 Tax=Katanobacteria TaxID=422282 RepID=A0A1F4X7H8_UNCKA|nr:MAG: hypothetical protein A2415_01325 [candidate division WWE3 bacterium RIFOXYC1_FULL_39_7]OGC77602.1 MAG: hypothetical protein A2619_04565 [candidate division WWE3 bacterium RIFOXYD1_FULL_39_9]
MTTFIVFILILSVLVLVHESGHFFVAKKLGIKVEEFGLGLPPRILGKQIGDTIYSLNLLPFGGFVKVLGEEPEEIPGVDVQHDPASFAARSPLHRLLVLGAGVFMNVVLAVVLFYVVLAMSGFKTSYIPLFFDYNFRFGNESIIGAVVTSIEKDSAAEKAGIMVGEAVLQIDEEPVNNASDIRRVLESKVDTEVNVLLKDIKEGETGAMRTVTLVPSLDEKGNPVLGVYLTKSVSLQYVTPVQTAFSGFFHAYNVTAYSLSSFGKLISLSFESKTISPVSQSVSGPVGIYQVIGSVLEYGGDKVLVNILDFIALMSISLAFVNILPLPALDGGRMLFVVIEKVRGKKISPAFEANIHKIGIMFLLGLIVLITIKDIVQ